LFGFAVVMMLLASARLLVGPPSHSSNNQMLNRFLGGSGLALLGVFLFFKAHLWVKWFAVMSVRLVLGGMVALLFFPQTALKKTPKTELAAEVALAAAVVTLSFKYANREPRKVEAIGLTGALVSFSLGIMQPSFIPPVAGIGWLALMQAIDWEIERNTKFRLNNPRRSNTLSGPA
jgi:hypothetical protein